MESKTLGFVKTLRNYMGGVTFNINCNRYERFVTKLMSTHGLLNEVPDNFTYRGKDGEWVTFKYTEYLSCHNQNKHWVGYLNNMSHDPIGL